MGVLDDLAKKANELLKDQSDKVKRETIEALKSNGREIVDDIKQGAKEKAERAIKEKKKKFKFDEIPSTLKEFKEYDIADLEDEYGVAALVIIALMAYGKSESAGRAMIDYLNGPEEFTKDDGGFIKDCYEEGRDYIIRSYFEGTDPDEDYEVDEYVLKIISDENSYEEENYCHLYVQSSGCEDRRTITLRRKPSTGQWFVWDFGSLLDDVQIPTSQDKWA